MNAQRIRETIEGAVYEDEETIAEVCSDFGRIVSKRPKVVAVPSSPRDVQKLVRLCFDQGWPVTTRGAAHSQGGQSLSDGGVLLDASGLNRFESYQGQSLWVQAGVIWGDLLLHTAERGLAPPVLTGNLQATVGGTLSTGGLGSSSHRYGALAENIEALEVVTGEGHRVSCSPAENEQLFHCIRYGLGQFGVITRVRLRLKRFARRVRTHYLLYDDLNALMADQKTLIGSDRFEFLESWCTPSLQGFRRIGEVSLPFAEWFYPMHLSAGADAPKASSRALQGLQFYRQVHVEETSYLEFARRLEPLFAQWRQEGFWSQTHPWMECLLPWSWAGSFISGVLKAFPPNLLSGGQVLLRPCRGSVSSSPLFRCPEGDPVMSFAVLPAVPRQDLPAVLPMLQRASDLCMELGGKRYLSGWIDFDHPRWKVHFGETWPRLLEWKAFYDPKGILNPGFIQYLPPAE